MTNYELVLNWSERLSHTKVFRAWLTRKEAVKCRAGGNNWRFFFPSSYPLNAMIMEDVWMTTNASNMSAGNGKQNIEVTLVCLKQPFIQPFTLTHDSNNLSARLVILFPSSFDTFTYYYRYSSNKRVHSTSPNNCNTHWEGLEQQPT